MPRRAVDALSIRATPFDLMGNGEAVPLLTSAQRQQLASVATKLQVRSGHVLYREDTLAESIFICADGAVKSFRELPSGTRRVAMFLFAGDIFGLAENGRYVNTAQTIAPSTVYRIPVDVLTALLRQDPELDFQFLCKVTHELREAQRRIIAMGRRDATGRFAMFLHMIRRRHPGRFAKSVIPLPMSRSDIAAYLGLSLEAVSRATGSLVKDGLLAFDGRHSVRVLDEARLDRLAADV
jgi:CRP/FNR family transcriptional regulator